MQTATEDAGCATGCEVHLPTGQLFDLEQPDPAKINLRDIAKTLSRICRWGGRLIDCVDFYSVAQHSVLVSIQAAKWGATDATKLAALWHDGAEAFTGDIPRPIKRRFPEFKALEGPIEALIYRSLGLYPHDYDADLVKRADNAVCRREARIMCRGSSTWNWGDTVEADEIFLDDPDDCRLPNEAFEMFWSRHVFLAR